MWGVGVIGEVGVGVVGCFWVGVGVGFGVETGRGGSGAIQIPSCLVGASCLISPTSPPIEQPTIFPAKWPISIGTSSNF